MPSANGLYYFFHEADEPGNLPILLIHGAGGSHLHWPPEIRRLNGFRVIALDLPGHGKSEGIGRQSISDYVEAIQDFMDAVDMPTAIVVGHSMGGGIALQLALDAPDRVLALVIVGGGSRLRVNPLIMENAAYLATFPIAVKNITDWAFGRQCDPRLRELASQRMEKETRPTVLHGDFVACDEFNISDQLSEIQKTTLIVCGTEDKMTPLKYSYDLHEQIKNSEIAEIKEAGHMVMLEKPHQVADALEGFFKGL